MLIPSFLIYFLDTSTAAVNIHRVPSQVRVTYDEEPGPQGFERVSRDLAKGGDSGRRAYLWLRRQSPAAANNPVAGTRKMHDELSSLPPRSPASSPSAPTGDATRVSTQAGPQVKGGVGGAATSTSVKIPTGNTATLVPIGEVVVAFGNISDPNVAGAAERAVEGGENGETGSREEHRVWERLDRSLNPGAGPGDPGAVFLWYRRGSEDESEHWSSRSLSVSRLHTTLWCCHQLCAHAQLNLYEGVNSCNI